MAGTRVFRFPGNPGRLSGFWVIFVIGLIPVLFSGCFSEGEPATTKRVFRYNQPNPITSLDPAFARSQNNIWAVHHLFNGLVELDEKMEVGPSLATRWEISANGLEYRFYLRPDVYFHDSPAFKNGRGRKLVARDVVYSFERLIDPAVHSPGSWIFRGKVREKNPFEAVGDSIFIMHLTKPFPPMLRMMTMQYCSVVPKEALDYYQETFRQNPVGTGPYYFKNWLEGQALILLRHEKYFEPGIPKIDGVLVTFISDRKTAYLELLSGNLDFLSGIESSYVNDLLTPEGRLQEKYDTIFAYSKMPYLNTEYLGINLNFGTETDNPLLNRWVRQALNYAIDRQKMLITLRNGVGYPADAGFIPKGLPSYNPERVRGYFYDPDKAIQLLNRAGYGKTRQLPELVIHTNKDYLDLCTFILSQWEEIGVKARIEVLESGTLRQMMAEGQVPLFRASWIADYPDGESFLTVFYGKNPSPPNYTRFSNDEFDRLYEQALLEKDEQRRVAMYQKMDSILSAEAPVIFLFYDETALFTRKHIAGIKPNAVNLLNLKEVLIKSGEE